MQILPAKPIIILQLVHVLRTVCRSMYLLPATNHNNHPKRIEVVVCDDGVIYNISYCIPPVGPAPEPSCIEMNISLVLPDMIVFVPRSCTAVVLGDLYTFFIFITLFCDCFAIEVLSSSD